METLEHLLARDLRREGADRGVGDLIFRVEPRPRRHHAAKMRDELGYAVPFERGDHERIDEIGLPIEARGAIEKALRFDRVDLVEDQHLRSLHTRQAREDRRRLLVVGVALFRTGIDQQGHDIGVAGAAPRRRDHRPVEPALRARKCRACRRR